MDSSRVECKLWWVHDIHIVTNTLQVDLLTLTQHLLAHRIFSDKDMWWERRWWCNSEYSANHNLCYFWNIFIIITNTIIGSIRSNSPLCTWCIIECWSLVKTLKKWNDEGTDDKWKQMQQIERWQWMGSNVITIVCMHALCSKIKLNSVIHNIGMMEYSVQ